MKHVADQRKRKRWLVPLALCLAVCLAIHPVGLNAVQAEEGVEENAVSAFWAAADAFWGENGKQSAFWKASEALWGKYDEDGNVEMTGAMDEYWEAEDDIEAKDAARNKVQDAMAAYKAAYAEVKPAFDNVTAKYNALSEEEKTAKDEENPDALSIKDIYTMIDKSYNGDDTGEYASMEDMYQDSCIEFDRWNYWDNEFQYGNVCGDFGSASEALWGNEDKGIAGAIPAYNEARDTNGDVDAAREKVLEAADGVKDAYALIGKFYDAMKDAYGKIPADKKDDLEESYIRATENKQNLDRDYEGFLKEINIWKYTSSNDDYWKARELFWESTNKFSGNEQENIAGAYPTYMAALESESEELDARYEEVLAARAAVEEAYETMTVKYEAENAAYAALTEDDRDDERVKGIHTGNQNDYNGWVAETYTSIHECVIPAPVRDSKISKYTESNSDYWMARELFWKSTLDFGGDPEKNTDGAYKTYMDALESNAAGLDALYEKALESRNAVEKAYETVKAKYQAENAAYAALNEAEQKEGYGDNGTVAGIHKDVVDDYNGWTTTEYNNIHEAKIPAPPVKVGAVKFKVVGVIGGRNVTFSTDTQDAVIYYSSTTSKLTTEDKCVKNGETVLFEDFYGTIYARAYVNGSWGNVSRLILKIPVVNKPVITCDNGLVTIKTSTPNSYIYYTTDGSTPSPTNGTRLVKSGGSFTVPANCTVKAIAVRSCFTNSEVVSANVAARKLGAPSFAVKGVIGGREVTFNSTEPQGVIYYSTKNTSNITTSDMRVKAGETVLFQNYYGTVYARTYVNGQWSNVSRLILKIPVVNKPTITAAGAGKVKITTSTPNCYIYYTTDGSTPSPTHGTKVSSSSTIISVGSGKTVKAIAVRSCFTNSEVATYKQK